MGCFVSDHQPDVAAELGTFNAVFRLPGRHSQGDLYDQRRREPEHELAKSDQDQRLISEPGGRVQAAVSGLGTYRQKVDDADPQLEGRAATLRDPARGPRAERPDLKNRNKNISRMGRCPKPRDLSLSRQDSWTGRRAALALPESRPLSRRSGCVSAEPYPPLRSVQSTRDEDLAWPFTQKT